jgi:predicted nucleic acid-binding protein
MGPSREGLTRAVVICDAGPLIHLDEIGCLDLLSDFQIVYVPRQVWVEVERHRPTALSSALALQKVPVEISLEPRFQLLIRTFSLDLGEQAALSLMESYPHSVLLTDDAAARLAAKALGYPSYGTLGVLLRSIRRQLRSREDIEFLLRGLPFRSTLHIRQSLLQEILEELEADRTL